MSVPSSKQRKKRGRESDECYKDGDGSTNNPKSEAAVKVLRLDLILERIGSFLPSADLRSLRRTCTSWNRAFVPSHRKKHAPISLTNVSLSNFNVIAKRCAFVPFGNYQLTLEPPDHVADQLKEFIALCGSSATSIAIWRTIWGPHFEFLADFAKGLAALKTLVLESDSFEFLAILRDHAPRLENLNRLELVKVKPGGTGDSSIALTTTMHLELLNELANQKQNQLRLKEFSFTLGLNNVYEDAVDVDFANELYDFLVTQCGSLHHLEIRADTSGHDRIISSQVRIPVMANLREFRLLRSGRDRHRFLQFDALTMSETFPSLQKYAYQNKSKWGIDLASEHEESREDDLTAMEIMGHQGVSDLELRVAHSKAWAELGVLRRFREGCPSVVHLHLAVSVQSVGDSLGIIWSTWPLMETATIKLNNHSRDVRGGGENVTTVDVHLDKALSGVPVSSSSSEMNQLLSNLTTLDDVCSRLVGVKTGAGLSDMTQLWKLVLDFSEVNCKLILGDVGGYFGVALAGKHRLQHFSIIRMKNESATPTGTGDGLSISGECEEIIRSTMGPRAELNF